MRCWKIELDKTNPHANQSWTGFSRGAPKQWIHHWPQKKSKPPPRVPWSIMQHWTCMFGKKWHRRIVICRKNCCNRRWIPVKDQLLLWAQKIAFVNGVLDVRGQIFGKLLITGLSMVANARFWSLNPSGRSSIQFGANAAASCTLRLAMTRNSLINTCCRYWGARIVISFALDIKYPSIVRTSTL